MSNGRVNKTFTDILGTVQEAGALDEPKKRHTFQDILGPPLEARPEFLPTTEPSGVGFRKGFQQGVVRPFRLFLGEPEGLEPTAGDLGFPARPGISRIIGDLAGMGIPITLATGGAGSFLASRLRESFDVRENTH